MLGGGGLYNAARFNSFTCPGSRFSITILQYATATLSTNDLTSSALIPVEVALTYESTLKFSRNSLILFQESRPAGTITSRSITCARSVNGYVEKEEEEEDIEGGSVLVVMEDVLFILFDAVDSVFVKRRCLMYLRRVSMVADLCEEV